MGIFYITPADDSGVTSAISTTVGGVEQAYFYFKKNTGFRNLEYQITYSGECGSSSALTFTNKLCDQQIGGEITAITPSCNELTILCFNIKLKNNTTTKKIEIYTCNATQTELDNVLCVFKRDGVNIKYKVNGDTSTYRYYLDLDNPYYGSGTISNVEFDYSGSKHSLSENRHILYFNGNHSISVFLPQGNVGVYECSDCETFNG